MLKKSAFLFRKLWPPPPPTPLFCTWQLLPWCLWGLDRTLTQSVSVSAAPWCSTQGCGAAVLPGEVRYRFSGGSRFPHGISSSFLSRWWRSWLNIGHTAWETVGLLWFSLCRITLSLHTLVCVACEILSEGRRFRLIEFYPTASKNMSHFYFSVVRTERSCHLPSVCACVCEREKASFLGSLSALVISHSLYQEMLSLPPLQMIL